MSVAALPRPSGNVDRGTDGDVVPARVQPSPAKGMTSVELTWIERSTERWIRFGTPIRDQILDRRRRLLCFPANSVFAFVRWASNDYGTVQSRLDIIRAVAADESYSTLPCVTPGGELLLHLGGWPRVRAGLALIDAVENLGIDPCAASHDYWRHAHNRLIAGHRPRPYSLRRHRAWLLRRELGA